MRIQLKGSTPAVESVVVQLETGNFLKANWELLGYTTYEVICIGASGGMGGSAGGHSSYYDDLLTRFGGGGGGGGLHKVSGTLASLSASTAVVIGAGGADGSNTLDPNIQAGNGGDGGATTFGGTLCRASGGKGGTGGGPSANAPGGDGGTGDSTTAGFGGLGADFLAGRTQGQQGLFNGVIGSGGGGGFGPITSWYGNFEFVSYTGPSEGNWGSWPTVDAGSSNQMVAKGRVDMENLYGFYDGGSAFWPSNGGGANAVFLTGSSFIAGTRHHDIWSVPGSRDGACFIKLSP